MAAVAPLASDWYKYWFHLVPYNNMICVFYVSYFHFCDGHKIAGKNRMRGFSQKKKKKKDSMVFSPARHWLLCTDPSFDINWVKHGGGREGGQQLDPTVNVTLVSQLHPCQSLAFRFISLLCPCTPLISVMLLRGTLRVVHCRLACACVQPHDTCMLTIDRWGRRMLRKNVHDNKQEKKCFIVVLVD